LYAVLVATHVVS